MKRCLLATNFDLRRHDNSREHQLVRWHARRCAETWVLYRRRCERGGWRQLLRDALVPHAEVYERDGVHYVEVNPLFNHYQGLAREVAGTAGDLPGETAAGPGIPRQLVFRLLSGLGLLKDLAVIGSLCWFGLRRVPGRFEACVAVGPWAAAAAWLWRAVGKTAAYLYEDIDYEPGFIPTPLRRRWTAWLERRTMARADAVVSVGRRLAHLRERESAVPVVVIPNGVDVAQFPEGDATPPRPVLIYAGNATYWSGLDVVLEALPAIRATVPGVELRIVGESPPGYRARLRSRARELGVAEAVTLTGKLPYREAMAHLTTAAIGLALFRPIALRAYAFPLKVVEYMAAGLPTIATADSESAELVARHDCGVSVPCAAEPFARAAAALLRDPGRRSTLARHARRAAAAHYDWAVLMEQDWQVLQACAHRGRSRRERSADG